MPDNNGVGIPISRLDGRAKVTGQATYAAEAPVQNAAHCSIVWSTIAKGHVTSIDTTNAKAAPGVIAVITPDNMPKIEQGKGMVAEKRTPLADNEVHYAGQHLAVVVADTPERARYAARLVKVTYAEDPPIIDIHDPKAKVLHPQNSMGEELQFKRGDVEAALATPGLKTVHAKYSTPVETHNPMEMGATSAIWESSTKLTAWNATQAVSGNQTWLASSFGLKPEDVHTLCPYTGGGFGCKGGQWPHIALAAAVAKAAGKPIKQVLTRQQMFTSMGHRPPTEQTLTLAAQSNGKIIALRHEVLMHGSPVSDFIEPSAVGTSFILYTSENYAHSHEVHVVDVAPPTFMRAPGESTGTYALECAMDELAWALEMDPVELRLRNYAEVHPNNGLSWSSKHLKECYALGKEKFGWDRRIAKVGGMHAKDGRRMGWGMATATYPARKFPGSARIRLSVENRRLKATSAAASQDLGTGTWTIGAQMTATILGLPLDRVKFEIGDSNLPPSGVSGGSTTAASLGEALSEAANNLRAQLLESSQQDVSSALKGLNESQVALKGDRLVAIGDEARHVDIAPLISNSGKPYIEGTTQHKQTQPGQSQDPKAKEYAFNSFGAHFVEVIIDDPSPRVIVNRVVSVMDIGKVLNPKTARSQVLGGVVMGIGMALMEETLYDPRTARPMTDNLADYRVPVNPDVHSIEPYFVEFPDTLLTPLGNRGVGEIGITGVTAAIANAVYHATGKRVRDLPITPDKLL